MPDRRHEDAHTIHMAAFITAVNPGAVGKYKLWINSTTGLIYYRNLTNTAWVGPIGGAGTGLPPGGTIDQVLAKLSSTDGDVSWQDIPSGLGSAWAPLVATVDDVPDLVYALVDGDYEVVMIEEYR